MNRYQCLPMLVGIAWGIMSALATLATTFATEPIDFIDTSFENASPLDWHTDEHGVLQIGLLYDHERASPNRAAGHWHFRLEGTPDTKLTVQLNHFQNVWNGRVGIPVSASTITFLSEDGTNWTPQPVRLLDSGDQIQFEVVLPASGSLYVARLPPYRISDLDRLLESIESHPAVAIEIIGKTVQGRELEIVRIGNPQAPHHVFFRGRAHPWEPGGNWVLDGMIRYLTSDDPKAKAFRESCCVFIMPMANKDGVANGWTRFNMLGKDLNRDWDAPADAKLAPENAALETWLEAKLARGERLHLAFEMHNDENGKLHISRPENAEQSGYVERMERLERLLRQYSWFREGSTSRSFANPGTLGEGWLARYGIDAVVHELNANWIEGLNDHARAEHWQLYGRQLCDVLDAYFNP